MGWIVSPGMLMVIVLVFNLPRGWWRPVVLMVFTAATIAFYYTKGEELVAYLWMATVPILIFWMVGIYINKEIPYNKIR